MNSAKVILPRWAIRARISASAPDVIGGGACTGGMPPGRRS